MCRANRNEILLELHDRELLVAATRAVPLLQAGPIIQRDITDIEAFAALDVDELKEAFASIDGSECLRIGVVAAVLLDAYTVVMRGRRDIQALS